MDRRDGRGGPDLAAAGIPVAVIGVLVASGFTIIQPNEARVVTFFGRYIGTLRQNGLPLHGPVQLKKRVPLKLINFVTDHLKVNDRNGNPIEIGAVVVWRVADAAQATFNVDDYKVFVANQSDIAIRALAAHYPYDSETETSSAGTSTRSPKIAGDPPAQARRRRHRIEEPGSRISPTPPKSPARC